MAIKVLERSTGNVVAIEISGKLESRELQQLEPKVEAIIEEYDEVNILVILREFRGYHLVNLWEDMKLGTRYIDKVNRVAIAGHESWEKMVTSILQPLGIRYFDISRVEDAWQWVKGTADDRTSPRQHR